MAVINKIKKGADEYDIQDPNAATKTQLQALETTVSGKQNALTETQLAAVNSGIDSTKVGQISTNTTNIGTNTNDISTINGKIPAQASTSNQLADKAFVTDAVQTNSAHFRGNWATWSDVPTDPTEYPIDDDGNHTPTSNDYMVIQDASGFPTSPDPALEGTWRFKYSGVWNTNGKNGWHPEYQVNETPLTSDQLAALNSGITTEAVSKLSGIEAGAEVNDIDSISVNGTAVTPDANKNVALTIPDGIKTLTTADYNWPTTGTKTGLAIWKLESGRYVFYNDTGSVANLYFNTVNGGSIMSSATVQAGEKYEFEIFKSRYGNTEYTQAFHPNIGDENTFYGVIGASTNGAYPSGFGGGWSSILTTKNIVNNLTSSSDTKTLSAAQGKYLNDNKADKTAFTGTDGTTAGTMGLVPAPATTDAGKFLKADGTWDTVSAGPTVVQTTGTSTTDVMSQDATTKMVYTSSGTGINIGYGTAGTNHGIAIGYSSSTAAQDNAIAIGEGATANGYNVAIGSSAKALGVSKMGVSIGRLAGQNMSSTIKGYVNLGSHSKATNTGEVNVGTSDTTEGYNSSNYRLISGLYDGQSEHDAATVAQGNTLSTTAPTTTTKGVLGQLYTDTTNMHTYQCTAIDTTDPQNPVYTWTQRW